MNNEESFFISLYSDIINGFSKIKWKSHFIYIKHHSINEMNDIHKYLEEYKNKYKKKGFLSEEELIKDAIRRKDWSEKDELFIKSQEQRIESLTQAANKISVPSHRERQFEFISKVKNEIKEKKTQRMFLTQTSLENISYSKANSKFIESIIFLDENFTSKLCDSDDIDEIEYDLIVKHQMDLYSKFSDDNISKLVLCDFFAPYMEFTKNCQDFFDKPVIRLTIFQSKLLSYSNMFSRIFENTSDIPNFIRKDPEAIIEFVKSKREADSSPSGKKPIRRSHKTADASARTVFGANQDDLNKMADKDEKTVNLHEEIKKRGGKLNMQQMMELMGVEK